MIFSACKKQEETILSQEISDWKFEYQGDWHQAEVPGNNFSDLLKHNFIPDPFYGTNEDSIQWVSERNWQYKSQFSVPKSTLENEKQLLVFSGLDTYAKVYLNDSLILQANNMFRTWEVDVSDILKKNNTLLIKFDAASKIETEKQTTLGYSLPGGERVFTRKAGFHYGWDWGAKISPTGIWRKVELQSWSDCKIKNIYISQDNLTDTLVSLTANIEIESSVEKGITIKAYDKVWGNFKLQKGSNQLSVIIRIPNPELWWPNGYGEQKLYDINISISDENRLLDCQTKKIGLRKIELITEQDSIGESFYFKLNGKPVYMKGANYIPQNIFLPDVDQDDYVKLIDDVVNSNMNMLRVWGGGVYEDNFFYQLCDAKGILVWQDFMFACAMYPGNEEFLENVKQEAIENVKRLRQHPSIALWCGNNENSEGWQRWGWKDGKTEAQKQEIWNGYDAVFHHTLPQVVDSLHPSVSYWESSPKFGRGDKRYLFEGDAHDWWVWHDSYPFEHFEEEVPRFMSEFGFQSFPSYETIQYFTEQNSIDLNHPSFANHQKHSRGFSLIKEYMERDFPIPTKGDDYVYMSQMLQAYGMTKGIHAQRRAKPYTMGTLYWQLNDCWPAVSWSSMDGLGNWKALQYHAKKAFENVIISTAQTEKNVAIYVVNDTFAEVKNTLVISHLDFDGNTLFEEKNAFNSPINSSEIAFNYDISNREFVKENSFLKLTYGDAESYHYFSKPKNLNLKNQPLDIEIKENNEGFLIRLISETLQKNVFLYSKTKGTFSDNFFDVVANVPKEIQFNTTIKSKPDILLKTLNQFVKD